MQRLAATHRTIIIQLIHSDLRSVITFGNYKRQREYTIILQIYIFCAC